MTSTRLGMIFVISVKSRRSHTRFTLASLPQVLLCNKIKMMEYNIQTSVLNILADTQREIAMRKYIRKNVACKFDHMS